MARTLNQTAIDHLRERAQARPPWQLLMVGIGKDNHVRISAETTYALTRLFDYLPELADVTLQTEDGYLVVSRDFPSGEMQIIDGLIASIFKNDPHITGIAFPATRTRPRQVATADKPHYLPHKAVGSVSPPKT